MTLYFTQTPKRLEDLTEEFQINHKKTVIQVQITCHTPPGEEIQIEEVAGFIQATLNVFDDLGFVTVDITPGIWSKIKVKIKAWCRKTAYSHSRFLHRHVGNIRRF